MTRALEAHLRLLAVLPVRTHLAEASEGHRAGAADFVPRRLQSVNPCARTLKNRAKREARLAAQYL